MPRRPRLGFVALFAVEPSHGLNDEEYAAIQALQQCARAPSADDPVWAYPLTIGLIWIDWRAQPPVVSLTPDGHNYPAGADLVLRTFRDGPGRA